MSSVSETFEPLLQNTAPGEDISYEGYVKHSALIKTCFPIWPLSAFLETMVLLMVQ